MPSWIRIQSVSAYGSGSTTLFITRVADTDPHYFWKLDLGLDPHQSEKLDLDLGSPTSKNSGALEAQNGAWRAVDAHNGGVEAQNGALEGL